MNNIEFAKRVLRIESDGILSTLELVDENFEKIAIEISKLKGHVITTGIGKSGNIASKLSSTFSSTGTPSFFIHPSEASHGDLGMITNDDIILALSVSGNTVEMLNIINFAIKENIRIIAFTCNKEGTLYKNATYNLLFNDFDEACNLKLAPSTSSTAMLAFGDALALTTSKIKQFSRECFKKYHPGGALGESIK